MKAVVLTPAATTTTEPKRFEGPKGEVTVEASRIVRLVCPSCGYGVCQRRYWCDCCVRWVADPFFHRDEDDSAVRWRHEKGGKRRRAYAHELPLGEAKETSR